MIIIADTITLYPDEIYENGLKLVTASTIRNHPGGPQPRIKVAELSEQHSGEDRRDRRRLRRSADAQPQGRSRRVHRR